MSVLVEVLFVWEVGLAGHCITKQGAGRCFLWDNNWRQSMRHARLVASCVWVGDLWQAGLAQMSACRASGY
jgi:hypothetical protein